MGVAVPAGAILDDMGMGSWTNRGEWGCKLVVHGRLGASRQAADLGMAEVHIRALLPL